jgi:hypothetical protein
MNRRQTRALSGAVESSQLVIPQREIPVAPFHIGDGAAIALPWKHTFSPQISQVLLKETV